MNPSRLKTRTSRRAAMMAASALLFVLSGCTSGPPTAKFRSLDSDRSFEQTFNRAYFGEDSNGDYNVVLSSDGMSDQGRSQPGPLAASQAEPLAQVLLIHILWTPASGAKPDQPSATNAAIDWHVFSNRGGVDQDHLHYAGAGFVNFSGGKDVAKVKIRTATLSLRGNTGTLHDPLGRSTVSGSFECMRNDALVRAEVERFHPSTQSRSTAFSTDPQDIEQHTPPSRPPAP